MFDVISTKLLTWVLKFSRERAKKEGYKETRDENKISHFAYATEAGTEGCKRQIARVRIYWTILVFKK